MKNYLKTGILLIGILFTLTNCEKENTIELNQINNPIIYKVTSLDNLFELKPIIENVKNVKSKGVINYKSSVDFLNLANINTNEIIQYTNETGYSTYTFKFENNPGTINFENLHLIEVDNGFIAYILSYEPDSEWYYSNISPEGDLYFDLSTYKGNITKYSLEKEIIWTTNNELINKFSKNSTTSKTSGGFMQVCVISMQPMCDYGGTLHPWGDKCTGNRSYDITETCQTVWAGGGDNTNPDDDGTTGGTGGGTVGEDCTNVTGTSIQDSLPLSGISSDCAPNTTIGLAYQTFWMSLSKVLQDYLDFRPKTKAIVLDYLKINNYAPQAELKVTNVTNEAYVFSSNNNFSIESETFSELAIKAKLNGSYVDFEEAYIETETPDDGYTFVGTKQLMPNPLILSNGDQVSIQFGTTKSDNQNANQEVSIDLINGIKFAIENANINLSTSDKITSIYIMATTNGMHSPTSNHSNGTAVDISRINGKKMSLSGITNKITELQKGFDSFIWIRENFGPAFKHKFYNNTNTWNLNYNIGGHTDHIHVSIRK